MALFEQFRKLHESKLYEDVRMLGSMLLTMTDHSPDLLTVPMKFHLLILYGDSLYELGEYKKAEVNTCLTNRLSSSWFSNQ